MGKLSQRFLIIFPAPHILMASIARKILQKLKTNFIIKKQVYSRQNSFKLMVNINLIVADCHKKILLQK